MASKSNGDNTYNFINGEVLQDDDLNKTFEHISPIGSVIAWLKNLTNTPTLPINWVECNGQTLSDADSVYNGVVIPNLNTGTYKILRGHSSSGVTSGSDTINISHTHNWASSPNQGIPAPAGSAGLSSSGSTTQSVLPANYSVVWIMRIK